MSWDYYPSYPRSTPRPAKGGIKAQSKQGRFGANWWAQRWIHVLESFLLGGRLQRGRSYARAGQVLNIHIETGRIQALVQGSRPKPYQVQIQVRTLTPQDTKRLGRVLAQQALFAAKLLAGEMPQDIEQAFAQARLSLFPTTGADLQTDCSCPDPCNPCKHIAAVYYLVGEEFDRDPFLIFKLRGIDREQLVSLLGQPASQDAPAASAPPLPLPAAAAPTAGEPLDPALPQFWTGAELPPDWLGEISPPPLAAALLKRLGHFPFWRGRERLGDALLPAYQTASQRARSLLLGEPSNKPDPSCCALSGKQGSSAKDPR